MKKILSLVLALMLILSLAVAASADASVAPSEALTFTFGKDYATTAGGAVAAGVPTETLKFTVTADGANPDDTMITMEDQTAAAAPGEITVSVPAYSAVGKWNYTVKEVAGDTQGVTYAEDVFTVQVLVVYSETEPGKLVATASVTAGAQKKVEGVVNKYDSGSLKVTQGISGNLASKDQKFDVDVTFTAEKGKTVRNEITYAEQTIAPADWVGGAVTVTVQLAHGEDVTFTNIPAGIAYSVADQSKHTEEDPNGSDPAKGYTVTYTGGTGTVAADAAAEAVVTNTKDAAVDTGIVLDSAPYMLLVAVSVVGLSVIALGKRSREA